MITQWRDKMLEIPWATGYGPSHARKDPGEDFFYIQDVRLFPLLTLLISPSALSDARQVGR